MSASNLNSPRIRFNWGYHDGAFDVQRNSVPVWHGTVHPDTVYAAGYYMGKEAATEGKYEGDSSLAWLEWMER